MGDATCAATTVSIHAASGSRLHPVYLTPLPPDHPTLLRCTADGLGGALYSRSTAVARVANRWPPRATAALRAFLALSSSGEALGYDMQITTYRFDAEAAE